MSHKCKFGDSGGWFEGSEEGRSRGWESGV